MEKIDWPDTTMLVANFEQMRDEMNKLRVENEDLHAECERLTSLLGTSRHPDDEAVDTFARSMKAKMKAGRDKGRYLVNHIKKGDPIDVANFCMMLYHHQVQNAVLEGALEVLTETSQKILSAEEVKEEGWYWWRPECTYPWSVARVNAVEGGNFWFAAIDFSGEDSLDEAYLYGQFIGPLKAPETEIRSATGAD